MLIAEYWSKIIYKTMVKRPKKQYFAYSFFLNKIEQTVFYSRYKLRSSDHFDISFKIAAQLDPKIWQFYEKLGPVAIETACPTVRQKFFENFFFIFLIWLASNNFLGSSRKIGKTRKIWPSLIDTNLLVLSYKDINRS